MYKLYYSTGACSMAVHIILREVGAQFEAIETSLQAGKTQTPAFLKLNPRGQVPLLVETASNTTIREGAAIITWLCDTHKSPLLPASGIARAKALEWLMWCNATLHAAYSKCFWVNRSVQDEAMKMQLMQQCMQQVQTLWDEADQRLASNAFLAGEQCTAADILMCVIANWNSYFPDAVQPKLGANVKRLIGQVIARPCYQQALQAENVTYKAAA
jgi:glutathione S-transferase